VEFCQRAKRNKLILPGASPGFFHYMKKALIITYYWPPSGGAGVQRWLKFSKYLREYGWEPIIYTPENPEYPAIDPSLMNDIPEGIQVIKHPIWEPFDIYKRLIGMKKNDRLAAGFLSEKKKPSKIQNLMVWIRGNFFIPDARMFWIKPSIRFLKCWLKENQVDAIVSTGPPHSMHLIALGLKRATGLPWLADFRDPWTRIDFYHDLRLTQWADSRHHRLEKAVLMQADRLVTVSYNWANDFKNDGSPEFKIITNGFDPADFPEPMTTKPPKFILTHIGSLNKDRNPAFLWKTLGELAQESEEFRNNLIIRFIGKTDFSAFENINENGLSACVENIDYVPHHKALELSAESAVLLLLINNTPNSMGIIPGKVFEYLATRRPLLCIGPSEGDSARIIRDLNAGELVNFGDSANLRSAILSLFDRYKKGENTITSNINRFSRKMLAGTIAAELDQLTQREVSQSSNRF